MLSYMIISDYVNMRQYSYNSLHLFILEWWWLTAAVGCHKR